MGKYLLIVLLAIFFSGCETFEVFLDSITGTNAKKSVVKYSYTYDGGTKPLFNSKTTNVFNVTNKETMGIQYTKIYPDGTTYRGNLINGMREGFGTTTWIDGSQYIGEYKSDKENGRGIYIYSNGKREVGIFENGKRVK